MNFKCKKIIFIFLYTLTLFLAGDFLLCHFIFNITTEPEINEHLYRIKDENFHHSLAKNFRGYGYWGNKKYLICTNNMGFKDDCDHVNNDKNFDIAFIGDSFTEGIGMNYHDSFVGIVAKNLPQFKVANLGVASYSPSIYFTKVKKLIEEGYFFKEIVVFVDISDIENEAVEYTISDNGRVLNQRTNFENLKINRKINSLFPLTHFALKFIRDEIYPKKTKGIYDKKFDLSSWTYNTNLKSYGLIGVDGGINKSLKIMNDFYYYLHSKNIKLSVGVYPWPGTILYDNEESRQKVIWEDFCRNKCNHFYNSFPYFFAQLKENSKENIIDKYYIQGDVHFNKNGNQAIADIFLKNKKN